MGKGCVRVSVYECANRHGSVCVCACLLALLQQSLYMRPWVRVARDRLSRFCVVNVCACVCWGTRSNPISFLCRSKHWTTKPYNNNNNKTTEDDYHINTRSSIRKSMLAKKGRLESWGDKYNTDNDTRRSAPPPLTQPLTSNLLSANTQTRQWRMSAAHTLTALAWMTSPCRNPPMRAGCGRSGCYAARSAASPHTNCWL